MQYVTPHVFQALVDNATLAASLQHLDITFEEGSFDLSFLNRFKKLTSIALRDREPLGNLRIRFIGDSFEPLGNGKITQLALVLNGQQKYLRVLKAFKANPVAEVDIGFLGENLYWSSPRYAQVVMETVKDYFSETLRLVGMPHRPTHIPLGVLAILAEMPDIKQVYLHGEFIEHEPNEEFHALQILRRTLGGYALLKSDLFRHQGFVLLRPGEIDCTLTEAQVH